jgi:hypothetical protein
MHINKQEACSKKKKKKKKKKGKGHEHEATFCHGTTKKEGNFVL